MVQNQNAAPFKAARRFARSLKLLYRDQWRSWVKSHRAELAARNIPTRPDFAYRSDGWQDWSDWLGSNPFRPKTFMAYPEWQAWMQQQHFKTKQNYDDWCAAHSQRAPDTDMISDRERLGVPSSPASVYAEFRGWNEELKKDGSAKHKGRKPHQFAAFGSVRQNVRTLVKSSADWGPKKLHKPYPKTAAGWRKYAREHRAELARLNFPASPDRIAQYQNNWRGWRDFLGVNTRPTRNRKR
jgi:hypothetical protein